MRLLPSPADLVRRGRTASTALSNAWQAMADDSRARAERQMLLPGRRSADEGVWLDAIDVEECWRLLQGTRVGRIGFTAHSGHPLILPVNYAIANRHVYIRSGRGPKLDAARRSDVVAFEVDDIDLERRTGWSVSVAGRAQWVRDVRELAIVGDVVPRPWVAGPREELIVIDPIHVGGRRLSTA